MLNIQVTLPQKLAHPRLYIFRHRNCVSLISLTGIRLAHPRRLTDFRVNIGVPVHLRELEFGLTPFSAPGGLAVFSNIPTSLLGYTLGQMHVEEKILLL